MSFLKTTKQS